MKQISLDKKYRTRDGREVQLWKVDAKNMKFPVLGSVIDSKGEEWPHSWTQEGKYTRFESVPAWDLIEVPPKPKFEDLPVGTLIKVEDGVQGMVIKSYGVKEECHIGNKALLLTHFTDGKEWYALGGRSYKESVIDGDFEVIR